MRTFNINDKNWFHNGKTLKIAGNMVCSYGFEYIQKFIKENGITHLDINGLLEGARESDRAPFPWPEMLCTDDAIKLLEALKGTPLVEINMAANCNSEWGLASIDQIDRLVDALEQTQIHTINLTESTFLEAITWGDNEAPQYCQARLNHFISRLKGSQVTKVIGIDNPELTLVLAENMQLKKDKVISLGQALCRTDITYDILAVIMSYMPESSASGKADNNFIAETEGSWAYFTALSAFSLATYKQQQYQDGWQQTASVLTGEETYLNKGALLFRRAAELMLFNANQPAESKPNQEEAECDKSKAPLLICQ